MVVVVGVVLVVAEEVVVVVLVFLFFGFKVIKCILQTGGDGGGVGSGRGPLYL